MNPESSTCDLRQRAEGWLAVPGPLCDLGREILAALTAVEQERDELLLRLRDARAELDARYQAQTRPEGSDGDH